MADQMLAQYGRYAGVGLQLALTMGVFAWLGWWLDGHLGSRPWLLIAGVFLGFTGGFLSLLKKVPPVRGSRRSDEDANQ